MNRLRLAASVFVVLLLFSGFTTSVTEAAAKISKDNNSNKSSSSWNQLTSVLRLCQDVVTRTSSALWQDNNDNDTPTAVTQLEIVGAGFPRTGTKSVEAALAQIHQAWHDNNTPAPVYRVYDSRAMSEHGHWDKWREAAVAWKDHNDLTLLRSLVEELEWLGYTVTLDIPVNLFAPALAQLRPKAKVLYTYRGDNDEEAWYTSLTFINLFAHTLFYCRPWKWIVPDLTSPMLPILKALVPGWDPIGPLSYPEHITRPLPWYEHISNHEHPMANDVVRKQQWLDLYRTFPDIVQTACLGAEEEEGAEDQEEAEYDKDDGESDNRFLYYSVHQGWDPLLKFLDVPQHIQAQLQTTSFPHINERASLSNVLKVLHVVAKYLPVWIGLLGYLIHYVLFVWAPRVAHRWQTQRRKAQPQSQTPPTPKVKRV